MTTKVFEKNDSRHWRLSLNEMLILQSLIRAGLEYGYQLAKDVESLSEGKVKLGPGTLYPILKRLLDKGFIERAGEGFNEVGQVRKLYRITGLGSTVLRENMTLLGKVTPIPQGAPA